MALHGVQISYDFCVESSRNANNTDHKFLYALNQLKTTLQCNVASHWLIYVSTLLGTCTWLLTRNVLATQMEMFSFVVACYSMNLDINFDISYSLFKYRPHWNTSWPSLCLHIAEHLVLLGVRPSSKLIIGLCPADEIRRYKATPSLIGWALILNSTQCWLHRWEYFAQMSLAIILPSIAFQKKT